MQSEPAQVTVSLPAGERALLTPLEVGRLRAALRDAAVNATAAAEATVWSHDRDS